MKKIEKNTSQLNININKDDNEINDFLYCWDKFGTRPNKIIIHNNYSYLLFNNVLSEHSKKESQVIEILPGDGQMVINEKVFSKISEEVYCSYIILEKNTEHSIVSELTFFYSNPKYFDKAQKIIEELNTCLLDFSEETSNNLNTVSINQNTLEIEPLESKYDSEFFDLYYSKKTMKDIQKLVKSLKKTDKGLSILYGERGTGKTSVINYLAEKLDRIVIFLPNSSIEQTINNSEFRKFLKRYDRPIIVIDDCEMLLNEFFTKSNIFSNSLLQMVDGLLSDSIKVNIITIFNVSDSDEIDHVLLDCNNLLKVIEFQELAVDEASELCEHLGQNRKIKTKCKVNDIIKNKQSKDKIEIGF